MKKLDYMFQSSTLSVDKDGGVLCRCVYFCTIYRLSARYRFSRTFSYNNNFSSKASHKPKGKRAFNIEGMFSYSMVNDLHHWGYILAFMYIGY